MASVIWAHIKVVPHGKKRPCSSFDHVGIVRGLRDVSEPAAPVGFDGAVLLVRCIRIPKITDHNLINDRFHNLSNVTGNTGK